MKKVIINALDADSFLIKSGRSFHQIKYDEIMCIEADGNYSTINLISKKKIVSRVTLSELLRYLPSTYFLRIHKSFIINTSFVSHFNSLVVSIKDIELPIGRIYQKEVYRFFAVAIQL